MTRTTTTALLTILVCVLVGCGRNEPDEKETTRPLSGQYAEALAEFNRGGALMEQYDYTRAAEAYEKAVRLAPDWVAARFNLGLAYFNMYGEQSGQQIIDKSREMFETILASDSGHLYANFCLGLYHQHVGEDAEALEYFQTVYESDRNDPYVAYKCAEAFLALGRDEEGTQMLEEVVAIDGGFITAIYRLALQYQRTNRREEAARLFTRFGELNSAELSGGSFVVQKVYGTAGKYYQVLGADNLPLESVDVPPARRILFSPEITHLKTHPESWQWASGSVNLPGVAVGDVDNDGDLDLCLAVSEKEGGAVLWLNDGTGSFAEGPRLARQGVSPSFGDIDNDGDLDLWLGCAGSDRILLNDGSGILVAGEHEELAGPETLTHCARLVDLDSDGDLDMLAFRLSEGNVPVGAGNVPGVSSIYNSNGDGSYTDVAAALGLEPVGSPVASVVYDDVDNDRDIDLVVFPAGLAAPIVWVNDRVGKFRLLGVESTGLSVRGVISATTGDPDKDGDRDLLISTESGIELYVNGGNFTFAPEQRFAAQHGGLRGTGGQFADMDNDGDLDIVIADALRRDGSRGPALLINDWPRPRFLSASEIDPGNLLDAVSTGGDASCVVADFTGDGRCDIFLAPVGAEPSLIANATPGGHWIELDLRGTRERDRKARSNRSAIGARVEIKTGTIFQQFLVGGSSGPISMPPSRVHAGLGDYPKVDWLRIVWPDGILQAELEVAADRVLEVDELQRKTSSCPYLFAWNGSRFEFVADFGGVGGLGYFLEPGSYAKPDPTEYLRIPRLEARDDHYVVQCLTSLEEVTYFDEAKLIAVDHPEGTEVYPHEMMAIGVAPPSPEIFCFQRAIDPLRVVDQRGVDVTDDVLRIDRRTAGATRVDDCFMGLAEKHFVELDFGDRLSTLSPDRRLILFLYGWVEYGYSSTNYAAAQAGMTARAPSIQVFRDGRWTELFHEVGYPAGIQHMMTLEVTGKIHASDRRIRISSNMELYWDRIFLAEHLEGAGVSLSEATSQSADLHFRGYPREYSPDGLHPTLSDYDNIETAVPWKLMPGQYTRYGEVAELLREADDCYVIMAHGDELTLRFSTDAFDPVPSGWRRTFILKTDSFCKDMDLYTAHPDAVEPLPFHAMSGYPYGSDEHYPDNQKTREYRQRFNTREARTR